jgi:transcriptional regulator
VNLGDKVLALATGKTQQEIAAACKGARANHVGAALSRHKRAGRIEERDGKTLRHIPIIARRSSGHPGP